MRLLSLGIYVLVFLPIWTVVRITGVTRFGRRFHRRRTTWERPVSSRSALEAPTVQPSPSSKGRGLGSEVVKVAPSRVPTNG
jgi:hypothetical protein